MGRRRLYLVTAIQLLLIISLDVWTPRSIAVPIFYIIPIVWFGVWSPPFAVVPAVLVSVIGTVLAALGFAVNMVQESTSGDTTNRILALVALWLSALVILMRKGFERDALAKPGQP